MVSLTYGIWKKRTNITNEKVIDTEDKQVVGRGEERKDMDEGN